jgi:hypothetical protein
MLVFIAAFSWCFMPCIANIFSPQNPKPNTQKLLQKNILTHKIPTKHTHTHTHMHNYSFVAKTCTKIVSKLAPNM